MSIHKYIILYREAMVFLSAANKSFADSFEKNDVPLILKSLKSIADGLIECLVNILKAIAVVHGRSDLFSTIEEMENALKHMTKSIYGIKQP